VLDVSQPEVMEFYETTLKVLTDLGAASQRTLLVFNKIDRLADPSSMHFLRIRFPDAHFVSVKTGEGMPELVNRLSELVADDLITVELRIPQTRADLIARLHREADIRHTEYIDNDVLLRARISPRVAAAYSSFAAIGLSSN